MQGRPMTFVFCLGQEWHPPTQALQSAKLFSHHGLLGKIGHAASRLTALCATRTIRIGLHS